MLGKSWRGGPCIYWTSSPCRRSTDSATTDVRSARQHPKCPETSQRCSRNVSFYIRALVDDATTWVDCETYEPDELAVRFHHRLVQIHAFPNGNGRHGRIAAEYLVAG